MTATAKKPLKKKPATATKAKAKRAGRKPPSPKALGAFDDELGPKYMQFKGKPKEAIRHLIKVKKGQAIAAMHRPEIGDIDIVWGKGEGKPDDYGLAHIIEKHGNEIAELGFKVEDFIPIVVQFGNLNAKMKDGKYQLESKMFRIVISNNWKGNKKNWVLTSFDLRKK